MGVASTVEVRGVEVVGGSDLALCCRIRGRDYWITRDRLLDGSSVVRFADRGIIIVARGFAEDRGLLETFRPPA